MSLFQQSLGVMMDIIFLLFQGTAHGTLIRRGVVETFIEIDISSSGIPGELFLSIYFGHDGEEVVRLIFFLRWRGMQW